MSTEDPSQMDEETCSNTVCVRKCCPEGEMFDLEVFDCAEVPEGEEEWKPDFEGSKTPLSYALLSGMPLCEEPISFEYENNSEGRFFLLKNGSLSLPILDAFYSPREYCLDHFFTDKPTLTALLCVPAEEDACYDLSLVHLILLAVSCAFLFATFIIYMIVSELRRSLYGRCLLGQMVSLLVGFLGVIISPFAFGRVSYVSCNVIACVTYLGIVSAFFWMNVLCFDMWSSFRNMLPPQGSSTKRFASMSAYAWGSACALCLVVVVMDCLPETEATSYLILPGFGINSCWFVDGKSKWAYLYSVVLILLVINLYFFLHVAGILIKAHLDHNRVLSNASTKKKKARMWIYLKLFFIMGIGWLSEVGTSLQYNHCYFIFLDAINGLQGFFIFLILICKRDTVKKIGERFSTIRSSRNRMGSQKEESTQGPHDGKERIKMKRTRAFSDSSTSCSLSTSDY